MPCVLIVEDDEDVRGFMEVLIQAAGYDTCSAGNGKEGLEVLRDQHPCVVLLDLMMPVMDGFQFRARQLQDPEIADVPVVCVSAVYDRIQVNKRLGLPCLPKPIDPDALIAEVVRLCPPSPVG